MVVYPIYGFLVLVTYGGLYALIGMPRYQLGFNKLYVNKSRIDRQCLYIVFPFAANCNLQATSSVRELVRLLEESMPNVLYFYSLIIRLLRYRCQTSCTSIHEDY